MSVPPENPNQPPAVFVGGLDDTLRSSSNESLPSFTGCIQDLTYGYEYEISMCYIRLTNEGCFYIEMQGF